MDDGWRSVDWQAEADALVAYLQSRPLKGVHMAALLERCLAELIGAMARDPAEADRVMAELGQRMRVTAAECCRPGSPAH